MFLKSDGILVKFPFFQGNVGKIFVSAILDFNFAMHYLNNPVID